jgi:cell division septum initiation protein DivIVA
MAKKDKKSAKKKDLRDPADVVDAVRGAVERTFQGGSEGGRNLLDDVASAAQRIRESFDDLRVLEDVRGLRAEVEALSRRVAELEKQAAKPAAATTASKPAARRTATPRKAPAKASAAATAAATTGPKPKPASKPAGS